MEVFDRYSEYQDKQDKTRSKNRQRHATRTIRTTEH